MIMIGHVLILKYLSDAGRLPTGLFSPAQSQRRHPRPLVLLAEIAPASSRLHPQDWSPTSATSHVLPNRRMNMAEGTQRPTMTEGPTMTDAEITRGSTS